MGCSRSGAVAVVAVILAGLVSMVSLLLPSWSKMRLEISSPGRLELTFGLWGSCVNNELSNATVLDSPVVTNGSEVIAIAPESVATEILTCGSYFDSEMVRISCASFRQFASGQCKRHEYSSDYSLCDSDTATAFLGEATMTSTTLNWLKFLSRACGKIGHASIALAVISSISTSLAIVLVFVGITCARIDSCIGKMGVAFASITALFQLVLAILWGIEMRALRAQQVSFGPSFYLNFASMVLHILSSAAAKKHQQLEKEAQDKYCEDLEDLRQTTAGDSLGSKDQQNLACV